MSFGATTFGITQDQDRISSPEAIRREGASPSRKLQRCSPQEPEVEAQSPVETEASMMIGNDHMMFLFEALNGMQGSLDEVRDLVRSQGDTNKHILAFQEKLERKLKGGGKPRANNVGGPNPPSSTTVSSLPGAPGSSPHLALPGRPQVSEVPKSPRAASKGARFADDGDLSPKDLANRERCVSFNSVLKCDDGPAVAPLASIRSTTATTTSNLPLDVRIAKYGHEVEKLNVQGLARGLNSNLVSSLFKKGVSQDFRHEKIACLFVHRIVQHQAFEFCSAMVIITHSIFIGAYVHYMATVSMEGHVVFTVGNAVLTFCFFMEVLLKAIAEQKMYFTGDERTWNWFDITLLTLVLVEMAMRFAITGKAKKVSKKILKIAELVRTARILRIFRFLKFSNTLSVIISKVFNSMQSLAWILAMMGMMIFVLAVCVTTGSLYILHSDGSVPDPEMTPELRLVDHYFGSVSVSIFSIFASMSGGYLWADLVDCMQTMGVFYQGLFVCFMAMITFAMLNIITGIFVDNATQADAELEHQKEAKTRKDQSDQLRELFTSIDESGMGSITCDEFADFCSDSSHRSRMEGIISEFTLNEDEAASLFKLLDENENGYLTADEFISGLIHLRGKATALDLKTLMFEVRNFRHTMLSFTRSSEDKIGKTLKTIRKDIAEIKNLEVGLADEIHHINDEIHHMDEYLHQPYDPFEDLIQADADERIPVAPFKPSAADPRLPPSPEGAATFVKATANQQSEQLLKEREMAPRASPKVSPRGSVQRSSVSDLEVPVRSNDELGPATSGGKRKNKGKVKVVKGNNKSAEYDLLGYQVVA